MEIALCYTTHYNRLTSSPPVTSYTLWSNTQEVQTHLFPSSHFIHTVVKHPRGANSPFPLPSLHTHWSNTQEVQTHLFPSSHFIHTVVKHPRGANSPLPLQSLHTHCGQTPKRCKLTSSPPVTSYTLWSNTQEVQTHLFPSSHFIHTVVKHPRGANSPLPLQSLHTHCGQTPKRCKLTSSPPVTSYTLWSNTQEVQTHLFPSSHFIHTVVKHPRGANSPLPLQSLHTHCGQTPKRCKLTSSPPVTSYTLWSNTQEVQTHLFPSSHFIHTVVKHPRGANSPLPLQSLHTHCGQTPKRCKLTSSPPVTSYTLWSNTQEVHFDNDLLRPALSLLSLVKWKHWEGAPSS